MIAYYLFITVKYDQMYCTLEDRVHCTDTQCIVHHLGCNFISTLIFFFLPQVCLHEVPGLEGKPTQHHHGPTNHTQKSTLNQSEQESVNKNLKKVQIANSKLQDITS